MTRTAGVWRGALAPARPVAGSCASKSVQPPIPRIAAIPTVELTEKRQTIRPPALGEGHGKWRDYRRCGDFRELLMGNADLATDFKNRNHSIDRDYRLVIGLRPF